MRIQACLRWKVRTKITTGKSFLIMSVSRPPQPPPPFEHEQERKVAGSLTC